MTSGWIDKHGVAHFPGDGHHHTQPKVSEQVNAPDWLVDFGDRVGTGVGAVLGTFAGGASGAVAGSVAGGLIGHHGTKAIFSGQTGAPPPEVYDPVGPNAEGQAF